MGFEKQEEDREGAEGEVGKKNQVGVAEVAWDKDTVAVVVVDDFENHNFDVDNLDFHLPGCRSGKRMSPQHHQSYNPNSVNNDFL